MWTPLLSPPAGAKIFEVGSSRMWFDESGILCCETRKGYARRERALMDFQQIVGKEKVCMLIDITNSEEATPDERALAADALPNIAKAVAMVSSSPLGRMLGNIFLRLKPPPYPAKVFKDVNDAKAWAKQFV